MSQLLNKSICLLIIVCSVNFLPGCSEEEVEPKALSNGEIFLGEVNLARNALASGEKEWNAYVEEVVDPVMILFFGKDFNDKLIELFGVNYYLEVKNAYQNSKLQGSSSYPSIAQSDFSNIKPLAANEKLRSGAEKWVKYFLANEVSNLHADFNGTMQVSEKDEKGQGECVAPKNSKYNSARNIVVLFLVDAGVASRGHRILLLNKDYVSGGGYFDTEVGGGVFRFAR